MGPVHSGDFSRLCAVPCRDHLQLPRRPSSSDRAGAHSAKCMLTLLPGEEMGGGCTHFVAKWPYFLTPSFLFPKKEVNRQQWMAHGQCWKDRMEEQAGEKVHRGPALWLLGLPFFHSFWVFGCFRGRKV